ncbi:hypothetical protein LTS10_012297 [Elasticomyces elasticus]|nr:hypothetical protein LTS10_012297 [Elasticomyces elasticus]
MGDAAPPSPPPSWSRTFAYYNPAYFHRRKQPSAPVYSRDFAYANNEAVVLAVPMSARKADINAETSAKTFAEYVRPTPYLSVTGAHSCHGMDEAKKLHKRLLSGPTVDIYVGPERRHWSLHRNLLCHHSSFFETEFEGHEVPKGDKDGENKLELPEDDAKGFELLVKWLYQGQLEDSSVLTEEEKYDYAVACHKLYMLCDKFDMIHLKNLAMDLYRANLNAAQLVPDADEINEIYRSSPAESPYRALMTNIAARQIMDPDVDKDAASYRKCFQDNPDFAVEMVNAIRYMSGGMLFDDPTELGECEYHDHSDGSTCQQQEVEAKPLASGTGECADTTTTTVRYDASLQNEGTKPSVAQRQLPAELSAEKRTPRKLNVQHPKSPTPKEKTKKIPPALSNGNAPSTPIKAQPPTTSAAPVNGVSHKPKQPLTNGHPPPATPAKAGSTTPSHAGTVNGGPPKLTRTPAKTGPPGNSVLGKRRATDGAGKQSHGIAEGPRRSSHSVNGIVQQLNGNSSDGSQSQAGANDLPARKIAPKLRKPQTNGG